MAPTNKKNILVYADWKELSKTSLMGILSTVSIRGKESFSFEYSDQWLKSGFSQMLDPDLQFYTGIFYPKNDKHNFGIFLDSCPDRWGRILMQRREAAIAKEENRRARKLMESDFLLGVFDRQRIGGLRFKTEEDGSFLNDNNEMSTPPWTSLSQLEKASWMFEKDNSTDRDYLRWLNVLVAPGSSLGGARPKAGVVDKNKQLWIAKFPSKNDDKDVAAWEMVACELGQKAGINMATGQLQKYSNKHHTYLTKRFDRSSDGSRIHFASAMTLLGYTDGENADGASYLEIVEFIIRYGINVNKDLEELWRRIVFNIAIKNTDDHLRNHGFLLTDKGWQLSPAYDINPNEYGTELSLNISESDNSLDFKLALSVSGFFRLTESRANQIIKQISKVVDEWRMFASKHKISASEQKRMATAFS